MFDTNYNALPMVDDFLERDEEVIRATLVRRQVEAMRPCDMGPCEFGEMTEEKRVKMAHWLENHFIKL